MTVPTIQEYEKFRNSSVARKVFSRDVRFTKENKLFYKREFAANVMTAHWSRQYEYAYVFSQLSKLKLNNFKILDAGSGWSFFPFFIGEEFPNAEVHCLDANKKVKRLFDKTSIPGNLFFKLGNLKKIPYPDNFFDVISCISVLEHTEDYETIIKEFCRVLKPKGKLLLTFDISLDGESNLPKDEALAFSNVLKKYFDSADFFEEKDLQKDIVTTKYFKGREDNLLPWNLNLFWWCYWFVKEGFRKPKTFHWLTFHAGQYVKK